MDIPENVAVRDNAKADCYSQGERRWMLRTQELRGRWLAPLLRRLVRLHVRPDHLTLASLLAGLLFGPLYLYRPGLAFVMLAAHVLLDGLDGPLARHRGEASRGGSFTDSMADQTVIAGTTLTLMYAGVAGALPGALYIVIYTVVVLFAMARNLLRTPYSWLFRPRFLVYGWMVVDHYLLPGTLNVVLWGCTGLLGMKLITGLYRIRNRL